MSALKCAYKVYVCVWDIIMKQLDLKKKYLSVYECCLLSTDF